MIYPVLAALMNLLRGPRKFRAFSPRKEPYAIGRLKTRMLDEFESTRDPRMEKSIMQRWTRLNRWIRKNVDLTDFELAAEQSNFDLCLQFLCQGKRVPHPATQDCILGNWWRQPQTE